MKLENGYKVMFDSIETKEDGTYRTIKASKTGSKADAEDILSVKTGEYKLVYEKDGKVYGSIDRFRNEDDRCFTELDAVLVASDSETATEEDVPAEEPTDEPETVDPTPSEEPEIEGEDTELE